MTPDKDALTGWTLNNTTQELKDCDMEFLFDYTAVAGSGKVGP